MYIKNTRGESFPERVPGANATPLRHHARVYIYPPRRSMCAPHTHAHTSTRARTRGETHRRRQCTGGYNGRSAAPPHRVRALYNMTIPPLQIAIVAGLRGKNRQDPFRVGYIYNIVCARGENLQQLLYMYKLYVRVCLCVRVYAGEV